MVELTRTLHQWRTAARRLHLGPIGRPDLAEQIRWALPAEPNASSSVRLALRFLPEDAALIERLVPVAGWSAPSTPTTSRQPPAREGSAADVAEAAEAIIAAHQRRQG